MKPLPLLLALLTGLALVACDAAVDAETIDTLDTPTAKTIVPCIDQAFPSDACRKLYSAKQAAAQILPEQVGDVQIQGHVFDQKGLIVLVTPRLVQNHHVEDTEVVCNGGEPTALLLEGTRRIGPETKQFVGRLEETEIGVLIILTYINGARTSAPFEAEAGGVLYFADGVCR